MTSGNLEQAWSFYSKVNKKAKVTGFDIQGRKTYCSAMLTLSKVEGNWTAVSNNVYVKNITRLTYSKWTRKYYLKNLQTNQYVTVKSSDNADGTFNLTVTVCYVRFTSPSLYGASYTTETKELNNLKSFPSTIKFGSGAKLTYKGGKYTLKYSKNTKSGKKVKNQYRSTVVYKKNA